LALLGYFIGKTVPPELFAETIQRYSSIIGLIILGLVVVGGVGYYLYKRRQKAA
jgi:LPXTG-motif cell wall anchor domain protein